MDKLDEIMRCLLWFLCCTTLLTTSPVYAEQIDIKDTKLITNSLHYVHGLSTDKTLNIGILYAPENKTSRTEASNVKDYFQTLYHEQGISVTVETINVEQLNSQTHAQILYISHGLHAYFRTIIPFSKKHHILTVSHDVACARSHACSLSARHEAAVEIYMNEGLMVEQGFDADAAFKFMVKRV